MLALSCPDAVLVVLLVWHVHTMGQGQCVYQVAGGTSCAEVVM